MPFIIGVVSQKGGVGKSTIAQLIGREFAVQDWKVKLADLDIQQATSHNWHRVRCADDIKPYFQVSSYPSISRALVDAGDYDLLIFDGLPHANQITEQIARRSDLVIIPSGPSMADREPAHALIEELKRKTRLPEEKFLIALSRVSEKASGLLGEAVQWFSEKGHNIIPEALEEKPAYVKAQNKGLALTESSFPTLNKKAEAFIQHIIDYLGKNETDQKEVDIHGGHQSFKEKAAAN